MSTEPDPTALEAAKRLLNQTQVPASLMGGESAIFDLADVQAVAIEIVRLAALPQGEHAELIAFLDTLAGVVERLNVNAARSPAETVEKIRQAAAALRLSGGGVGVKALEWRWAENGFPPHWFAVTPFGDYMVEEQAGSDSPSYSVFFRGDEIANCETEERAKEVGQKHHEQRVLSALTPAPDAGADKARTYADGIEDAARLISGLISIEKRAAGRCSNVQAALQHDAAAEFGEEAINRIHTLLNGAHE